MNPDTRAAIDALAADIRSGASELLPRAVRALHEAAGEDSEELWLLARAVGDAQPAMASFWNAALAALGEHDERGSLERFEQRWRRAGAALARTAAEALGPGDGSPLRVTTWSFSGSVVGCLRAMHARYGVAVTCAEGRPACEGRRLAETLAKDGIPVEFYTDAAIGEVLWRESARADLVLVGADAVTPDCVVNKSGTGMLAATASMTGVPVYVAATRDKFVDARVARLLRIPTHDPAEIWNTPPPGVTVRHPCFERVPIDWVTLVVTDAGVLTRDMIGEACRAASARISDRCLERLIATRPFVP